VTLLISGNLLTISILKIFFQLKLVTGTVNKILHAIDMFGKQFILLTNSNISAAALVHVVRSFVTFLIQKRNH
jgi:hypothetical protein